MGCALLSLNEEKQLSHAFSPRSEIKKTNKVIEKKRFPIPPHILKNNNTVAVENRREGKWTQWERQRDDHSVGRLQRGDTGERWQSKWCRRWDHTVWSLSVCDLRTSNGLARREGRGKAEGNKGTQRQREESREEKELDGPFLQSIDTPFVSLAHSNLHTQYAAAVS